MKRVVLIVVQSLFIAGTIFGQQAKPELLKQPDGWSFERFNLPPTFAPGITYKGFEELRFAPGMFKKDSVDYFTYAFVASLDNLNAITQKEIQTYLLNYYKGLCGSVARDNKLKIDTSRITVTSELSKKNSLPVNDPVYNFSSRVFGVFADGAPVKLNIEARVIKDITHQKLYLLFIVSPKPKTSAVWKELYQVQEGFRVPD